VTVRYEVTLDVPAERAEAIERYMRERHIPDILATGCFRSVRLERASETRVRTSYEAATRMDFERYLKEHAERFRTHFWEHVGQGVVPLRELWEEVATYHP